MAAAAPVYTRMVRALGGAIQAVGAAVLVVVIGAVNAGLVVAPLPVRTIVEALSAATVVCPPALAGTIGLAAATVIDALLTGGAVAVVIATALIGHAGPVGALLGAVYAVGAAVTVVRAGQTTGGGAVHPRITTIPAGIVRFLGTAVNPGQSGRNHDQSRQNSQKFHTHISLRNPHKPTVDMGRYYTGTPGMRKHPVSGKAGHTVRNPDNRKKAAFKNFCFPSALRIPTGWHPPCFTRRPEHFPNH